MGPSSSSKDKNSPTFMDDELKTVGAVASISDYRPTVDTDERPIHHSTLHLRDDPLMAYLGLVDFMELTTLTLSAPVLKYVPIGNALLTEASNGGFPSRQQVEDTCSYALAFIFNTETMKKLPDTVEGVKAKYCTDLAYDSVAGSKALADTKRRGEVLAAVVLSFYKELLKCPSLTAEEYESLYGPYATELENSSFWGQDSYVFPVVPLSDITWPDWGPVESACPCSEHDGVGVMEHWIEPYHRALTLLRYAARELHPDRYLDPERGLGRPILGRIKAQVAIQSARNIKKQQHRQLLMHQYFAQMQDQAKDSMDDKEKAGPHGQQQSHSADGGVSRDGNGESKGALREQFRLLSTDSSFMDPARLMLPLPEPGPNEGGSDGKEVVGEYPRHGTQEEQIRWTTDNSRTIQKMFQNSAYEYNKQQKHKEAVASGRAPSFVPSSYDFTDQEPILLSEVLSAQPPERDAVREWQMEGWVEKIQEASRAPNKTTNRGQQKDKQGPSREELKKEALKRRMQRSETDRQQQMEISRILQRARSRVNLNSFPLYGSDQEKMKWIETNLAPYSEEIEAIGDLFAGATTDTSEFVRKVFKTVCETALTNGDAGRPMTLEDLDDIEKSNHREVMKESLKKKEQDDKKKADKKKQGEGKMPTAQKQEGVKGDEEKEPKGKEINAKPAKPSTTSPGSICNDSRIRAAFEKMGEEDERKLLQQRPTKRQGSGRPS